MNIRHDDAYYESRKPLPDLGPMRNCLRFIYNHEKKTFFDRSGKEWVQVCCFYVLFFGVLGAIFALQLWLSLEHISKLDKPFFQHSSIAARGLFDSRFPLLRSFNFGSPGIGFKPNIFLPTTSPIIYVNEKSNVARPKRYIGALTDFLQEYKKNISNYDPTCTNGKLRSNLDDRPCFFDIKTLGDCSVSPYGYANPLTPCVLLKFNKRFDWMPVSYNQSSELPANMPQSLKDAIRSTSKHQVWVSCDGAQNVDKEHVGEIEYIPSPGFPVQYFPFTGQSNYLSPIVAVRFKSLTPGRLVTVECALWAYNIIQDSDYVLDFQIMIGEPGLVARWDVD